MYELADVTIDNCGDEHNHAMFEKYYGYWK